MVAAGERSRGTQQQWPWNSKWQQLQLSGLRGHTQQST
jgi:hypothetical protein